MPAKSATQRTGVIAAVTSRLGFFVLVVLVAEGLLAIVASRPGVGMDRILIISGMLFLLLIVVLAVVRGGSSLSDKTRRFELLVVLPEDLGLTNRDVDWVEKGCLLYYNDNPKPIQILMIRSIVSGNSFHVHLPERFIAEADGDTHCELHLTDSHGVQWRISRFYLFKIQQPLQVSRKELVKAYSNDE